MIQLNENGRTLVKVGRWDDMFDRPGFERVVNSGAKLKDIIGWYRIPSSQEPCGLKNCRTKHNGGYLVVLEDGRETNVGNVCGDKHFGTDFKLSKNSFHRAVNAQEYSEQISETQSRLAAIRRTIEAQRNGKEGAEALYIRMHAKVSSAFDEVTSKALRLRAQRKNAIVSKTVRAVEYVSTEEDDEDDRKLADEERSRAGGQYQQHTLFTIYGLDAVTSYSRLSPAKYNELLNELSVLETLDIDSLDYKDLKYWAKWENRLEKGLADRELIMENCLRFLARSNIQNILSNKRYLPMG